MTQLVPFDVNKAGTTPNMCLDNVRRGYGIPAKYGSAWEAWLHTQQHPDRNIPMGLAVPLYYSYTATIDGVTDNFGHINTLLPDGRVWSDGKYYANLDAYLANHTPKYVGWGESVNDVKVITGENMNPSTQNVLDFFKAFRNKTDLTPTEIKYYTDRPFAVLAEDIATALLRDKLALEAAGEYTQVGTIDNNPIFRKK